MKPVTKEMKTPDLENGLDFWLDILQLWRSHLAFLQVRLKGISQTKRIPLSEAEFDYFLEDIALFGEDVLADYQESLRADLTLRKGQSHLLTSTDWVAEHDLFQGHMRQLKREYTQLLDRISAIIEPEKEVA